MKFQVAKVYRYGRFMGYGIAVDGNLLDGQVSTTVDTDAKGDLDPPSPNSFCILS